jgi:hypothetical protein
MIPGLMAFGSDTLALPAFSGCELGGSLRACAWTSAHEAASAAERVRPAIDNNLIAIGVSRIPQWRFAVVSATAGHRS